MTSEELGADLIVIRNCGHVRQEKRPEDFLDVVTSLVDKIVLEPGTVESNSCREPVSGRNNVLMLER